MKRTMPFANQTRHGPVTRSFQDWEELTQIRIERGLTQGLEDIEHGRFEAINDANTATRIVKFKERINNIKRI